MPIETPHKTHYRLEIWIIFELNWIEVDYRWTSNSKWPVGSRCKPYSPSPPRRTDKAVWRPHLLFLGDSRKTLQPWSLFWSSSIDWSAVNNTWGTVIYWHHSTSSIFVPKIALKSKHQIAVWKIVRNWWRFCQIRLHYLIKPDEILEIVASYPQSTLSFREKLVSIKIPPQISLLRPEIVVQVQQSESLPPVQLKSG